jgi:MinD-like ATPase involved in chromosome partitioning or flagellar assembly
VTTVAGIGKRTDSATVAAGLAAAYAERGKRVLLVDANLNEPRLDTLLGLHAGAGLHQVLRGKGSLKEALIPTPLTDVTLLAAGPLPAQSEKAQISPEQISNLLEQLRGQFDLVIVDLFEPLQQRVASSVLADTDTLMLVAHEREISESSLRPYAIWSRQSTSAEMPTLVIYNGANGNDPSQSQPALIPQAKGS